MKDVAKRQLIRVRGLNRSFGHRAAVCEVSLDLWNGEVLGLVGPNGAGKTTTLRLLAGLLAPDSGEGEVFGRSLASLSRGDPGVGYMAQKLALYDDLTVRDNLRFRADIYCLPSPAERVRQVLQDFDLDDRAHQRVRELSGGWARRVQLAAALIHKPAIVLLDEPTAGLDSESRQDVWSRIARLAEQGTGVVVNTHDLYEAERCSRVAMFRSGRLIVQGPPRDLQTKAPIQAAFVERMDREAASRLSNVIAVEPHGDRRRVLVRRQEAGLLRREVEAAGGAMTSDDTRLSDLALLDTEDLARLGDAL